MGGTDDCSGPGRRFVKGAWHKPLCWLKEQAVDYSWLRRRGKYAGQESPPGDRWMETLIGLAKEG